MHISATGTQCASHNRQPLRREKGERVGGGERERNALRDVVLYMVHMISYEPPRLFRRAREHLSGMCDCRLAQGVTSWEDGGCKTPAIADSRSEQHVGLNSSHHSKYIRARRSLLMYERLGLELDE